MFRGATAVVWASLALSMWLVGCDDDDPGGNGGIDTGDAGDGGSDASQDTPADTLHDTPADTPTDTAEDTADDTPEDTSDVTEEVADGGDIAEDVSDEETGPGFTATADPIATDIATEGTTQIELSEALTVTYEVTGAPENGTAAVDEDGLVTFTPAPDALYNADGTLMPYPWEATDTVEVTVTGDDGSVVVDVAVTIGLADWTGFPPAHSEEQCSGDVPRYLVTNISPAPGAQVTANAETEFTVEISYYIPEGLGSQEVGLIRDGDALDVPDRVVDDIEPGCDTVELTGDIMVPGVDGRLILTVPGSDFTVSYGIGDSSLSVSEFLQTTLAPGTLIDDPSFEIGAIVGWDFPEVADDNRGARELNIETVRQDDISLIWNHTLRSSADDVPTVMRGTLACDQTEVLFVFYANVDGFPHNRRYLVYPSVPPAMAIHQFIDGYPIVPGTPSTLTGFVIDNCQEVGDVTLSASEEWIELSVTETTLPLADLEITLNGTDFEDGVERTGFITVTPDDDAFEPLVIPVRAVGRAFDAEQYEAAGLAGLDDGAETVTLPFGMPVEGADRTEISVSSNGMIGLTDCFDPAINENVDAPWNAVEPDYDDCAFVAVGWNDMAFDDIDVDSEVPVPDVYTRSVDDETGTYFEVVYWNWGSYSAYQNHTISITRLFEDGSITVDFPQSDLRGLETVGWFHSDGSGGEVYAPMEVGNGFHFDIEPIAAP